MDSLTQIVVGIATVEAIAGKELKNKSFLVGGLLGTLPDIDIWIGKLFPYQTELAFHRAFTHSLLGIIVLSPLVAWLLRSIIKTISFPKWVLIVAATIATHVGIDLFTSWGVQLLYPLPDRFSLKTIFVVDVFYTIPWIICLVLLFRKQILADRLRLLRKGFIWSSSYLVLTVLVKLWVVHQTEKALTQLSIPVQDFLVKPTFSNIILWNINVKTKNGFYIGDYSIFDKKNISFSYFPKDTLLEQRVDRYPAFQTLAQVSEHWYTVTPYQDSTLAMNDLRFGWLEGANKQQQFVFSYQLIPAGNDVTVKELPKTIKDGKGALLKIWNRILHPL